jgi:2-keto-4-pentenoate hydratase
VRPFLPVAVVLAALLAGCQVPAPPADPVARASDEVYRAQLYERPAPLLSSRLPLSSDQAYQVQRNVVLRQLGAEQPRGFAACLSSPASREAYGGTAAIAGVLLPRSELAAQEDGHHVKLERFARGVMELELGFRLGSVVNRPVADVAALKELVVEVVPVLDLRDHGRAEAGMPAPADRIVNNLFLHQLIVGPGRAPAWHEPDGVAVILYREGEELVTGSGAAVDNGQWQTLLDLINRMVGVGWEITPEQLLLTGPLAAPQPLRAGLHVADFGELGRLEVWVE